MDTLQALCDTSCVQPIQVTSRWQAWLADNGIAEGKPVNQAATVLARTYSWPVTLYGPTVITGLRNSSNRPACHPARSRPSSPEPLLRQRPDLRHGAS